MPIFRVLIVGCSTLLAGCAAPAFFKDPATGRIAHCTSSTPGVFPIIAQSEINTCADAYTRMGWQRQ